MIGLSPAEPSIPLRSGSIVRVGILLLFLFLPPAHAPANDSLDPAHPADQLPGRDFAGLCASCHGTQGISTNPMVPSLAGQDGTYLKNQLQNFRQRHRRHAAMQGVLSRLTPEDMAEMALYYEKQPPMRGKGVSKKTKIGEPVYEGCKGCHGNSATGSRGVPRLAGQQAVYLERELLKYQAGTRSTPGMNEAVARLTPEQIKALSLYLSSMK